MVRFSTIAVFSPAGTDPGVAVRHAARLVEPAGRVLLVDVQPERTGVARVVLPDRLDALDVLARHERLRAEAARAGVDTPVETRVLVGHPLVTIVRMVEGDGVDLLIKAGEGAGPGARLTSFDVRLLRKCPCPAWIAQASGDATGDILAAIDPVVSCDDDRGLAHAILDAAVTIAERTAAGIHVVHAWSLYGEHLLRSRLPATEVDAYLDHGRRTSAEALARVVEPFRGRIDPAHVHLVAGDPDEAIVRLSTALPARLLVMGTVARTGLPGLLMGNTAETVLPRVACDVLVIKPQGFVSPLSVTVERGAPHRGSPRPAPATQ